MKRLTKEQVLLLHSQLIQEFGGAMTCGRKDFLNPPGFSISKLRRGRFVSALSAKAAQLGYGLIKNHPFLDGNKRIGAHVMLVFLSLNGIELSYSQEELIETILAAAAGKMDNQDLLLWIIHHEI